MLSVIREIKIKVTMRYYFTLIRMVIIEKIENKEYWGGCGDTGVLRHCWREHNMMQQFYKPVWQFYKRLKLQCDPVILLLRIYPRELKTYIHIKTYM